MTIVYTAGARADIDDIIRYSKQHFPAQLPQLEARLMAVLERIECFPRSAPRIAKRDGVRVVPLLRYPFRIFYREIPSGVEVLYVRHTARDTP